MDQREFSLLNYKGGVGKTTTSYNLAILYAGTGKKVLAIDLDPQSHYAISLGLKEPGISGVDDIFLEDGVDVEEYLVTVRPNLDLLPSGFRLGEVEKLSSRGPAVASVLRNAIAPIKDRYDIVIIDCPPSSGLLNFNALFASKEVLIPVSSDFLSLQGLSQLLKTLKSAQHFMGRELDIWIVLTRYATRRRLSRDVRDKLMEYFPNRVLRTVIRESAPIAESPGFGLAVTEYRPRSNGAQDYLGLADDIIHRRTMVPE